MRHRPLHLTELLLEKYLTADKKRRDLEGGRGAGGHVLPSVRVSENFGNLRSILLLIFDIDFVEFYTIIYWLCKGHDYCCNSNVVCNKSDHRDRNKHCFT